MSKIIVVILALWTSATAGSQCRDCWLPLSPAKAYATSTVVFSGSASGVIVHAFGQSEPKSYLPAVEVMFQVDELLKGDAGETLAVRTPLANECGFEFQVGERYVVYAIRSKAGLVTSSWAPVKTRSSAEADLAILRGLLHAEPANSSREQQPRFPSWPTASNAANESPRP